MSDLLPEPPASWRARAVALRDGLPVSAATVATGALVVVALVVVGAGLLRDPSPGPAPVSGGAASRQEASAWTPPTTEPPALVVHVAGAVVRPGIHRLRAGARIADAVDVAGGPLPDADLDALNLAAKLGDGDRVYVPRRGEVVPPAAVGGAGATSGPSVLDLNSATVEQLDALPGIGPATAQAIVAYRNEHGRFRSVDGLLAVRGIGPAKLAALRSRLRV